MMEHHFGLLIFTVRAIAAGAGGRPLAAWALEEMEREDERRRAEQEAWQREMMGSGQ